MTLFDLGHADENAALKDIIAGRIRREGPITFRDFMDAALYHPAHGYYVSCDPARDYQSSPNVHPIFGACVGMQLVEMWRAMGSPDHFDLVEAGAGSGRLAGDILRWMRSYEPHAFAAVRYRLQDATYTGERGDAVIDSVGLPEDEVSADATMPGEGEVEGVIFSNELIDAFPVHRVRVRDRRLRELRVALEGEHFVEVEAEPVPEVEAYFEPAGLLPGEGAIAEVNLEAAPWLGRAASALRRGYVLTFDYGYPAAELYASWRKQGTLLTFYRHTSGDDPYVRVGRQDITASVDFTALERAGSAAGLTTAGLTTQSEFLAALGIGEAVARRPEPAQLEAYYALRRAVIELTDPTGLGRIRVLAQSKGLQPRQLGGFRLQERAHA